MELKLTRPICFFDLETTGIDVAKDRIVEISIFKVYPNGNKESKTLTAHEIIHSQSDHKSKKQISHQSQCSCCDYCDGVSNRPR